MFIFLIQHTSNTELRKYLAGFKKLAVLRSCVSLACTLLYTCQRQFQASSQVELGKDTYASNSLFLEDCILGFFKHGAILPW